MVDSRSVAALELPPQPSIASARARVVGYARVPLKVTCSMKWATPHRSGVSRREPASTYTATDSERLDGRRAEMTRGPLASVVRWNIGRNATRRTRRRRALHAGPGWTGPGVGEAPFLARC